MSNNYEQNNQNNQNKYNNSYDESENSKNSRISRTARIRIRIRATTGSRTRAANRVHNFSGAAARQPYLHIFRIHI